MKKIILVLMLCISTFSFSQKTDSVTTPEQAKKVLIYNQTIIKKFGKYHGELILKGKICIGMSKEAIIESWGRPTYTYKITSQLGIYEQWFYAMKPNYGLGAYLYFENNYLNTISQ